MLKFKFTKRSINALPCPQRRIIYTDTEVKEFKLYHLPSGNINFFFKKRHKLFGDIEKKIAPFPSDIDEARLTASNYAVGLAKGIDPREKKKI